MRVALEVLGISGGDWAERLAEEDAAGFPALLKRMEGLPARQREELRGLLFGRWAELDPVGAAARLAEEPLRNDLTDFLRHWARLDFRSAAAWAEEAGPDLLRRTARDHALLDPQDFLHWLAGRPELNPVTLFDSDSKENLRALRRLTERDPRRMLVWSRALPEEKLKPEFLRDLGSGMARIDHDKAMEWARSLSGAARSDAALAGVAGELAARDPRRALEIAAAMKASVSYDPAESQHRIIQKLNLADAGQMRTLLAGLPESALRQALAKRVTIEQLAVDPAKAFSMAAELGPEAGMMHRIEIPWGMAVSEESARGLLEAAAGAPASSLRDTAAREALMRWMEISPASLAAYLKGRMDTPFLASMREALQAGMGVMRMRDGTVDPALREAVGFSGAAYVRELADGYPHQAAAALDQVEDPAARHRLTGEIADQWARWDRAGVMEWAAGLPDPADQAAAWRAVSEAWTREDSWQASHWISGLPAGPGRDAAVRAMTTEISGSDPDLAWRWALTMNDSAQRADSLAAAAASWRDRDPAALESALADPALPAAERARVLERLRAPAGK